MFFLFYHDAWAEQAVSLARKSQLIAGVKQSSYGYYSQHRATIRAKTQRDADTLRRAMNELDFYLPVEETKVRKVAMEWIGLKRS